MPEAGFRNRAPPVRAGLRPWGVLESYRRVHGVPHPTHRRIAFLPDSRMAVLRKPHHHPSGSSPHEEVPEMNLVLTQTPAIVAGRDPADPILGGRL